ncbi:DUF934 domain-containing protein [Alloalcanivorax profundimaris]|jgi:uncharacterized protein (DUF934 family)|uniref:DUF934 domain-containing protein n=1 Tax=Alloalcanivorax profundimaris TaxID=2735259 RepID=A0ABS0AN48_9GAMM|nr:DUF934 domain-containing protein [Alloalcanivorax profundimaris]MBM1145313.1 DUF934 domain-containing protein [Alcanivorax sp. ZXX171]MBU59229.1 oxidoreductase [Alcanivorax sp.]MCQ6262236.1 DUF934 domain-containing protein [Alcanivorax sp. MM125-6]QJX01706.1 DUF934 domain-containing protein [Alcanivorax sp. IO_7]MBF1800627.1 DUF934 domain-containing protein [Alloalcanivorax profundimaris]
MANANPERVILDGEIVDNTWVRFDADQLEADGLPDGGAVIVPLAYWKAHRDTLLERNDPVGVCLEPGEEPADLAEDLPRLSLVAVHFPAFKDGRGYSYARELRTRYRFEGEVRAVGDVLQDQLFYLHRVGFNAFEVRADRDIEEALENGLRPFTVTYQGDVHDPRPIYQRRPA